MIIFWILTFFVGSSAFAYIYLQYDVTSSPGFALVTMLLCLPSVPERPVAIAGSA